MVKGQVAMVLILQRFAVLLICNVILMGAPAYAQSENISQEIAWISLGSLDQAKHIAIIIDGQDFSFVNEVNEGDESQFDQRRWHLGAGNLYLKLPINKHSFEQRQKINFQVVFEDKSTYELTITSRGFRRFSENFFRSGRDSSSEIDLIRFSIPIARPRIQMSCDPGRMRKGVRSRGSRRNIVRDIFTIDRAYDECRRRETKSNLIGGLGASFVLVFGQKSLTQRREAELLRLFQLKSSELVRHTLILSAERDYAT